VALDISHGGLLNGNKNSDVCEHYDVDWISRVTLTDHMVAKAFLLHIITGLDLKRAVNAH
jgi:hypothetical protein